ncbi:MAG: hypothetical protein ABGX12_04545 [Desulfurobacteriaceae bacterium]
MKLLPLFFILTLLLTPVAQSKTTVEEDKPVEAWITYKTEGNKVIEVIKVKTAAGKIYEITPHLKQEKIPKPVSTLPEELSDTTVKILIGLNVLLFVMVVILAIKVRKLRKATNGPSL